MPVLECPNCHLPTKEHARFCHSCGASLNPLKCPTCDTAVQSDERFCPGCGTRLSAAISLFAQAVPAPQTQEGPQSPQPEDQAQVAPHAQQPRTGAAAAEPTKEVPPGKWHQFKNAWYGFTLEKPVDWYARTFSGVTTVAPDAEGYVGVTIRLLQVHKDTSAETLARYMVGAVRKVLSSCAAWSDPPGEGEAADPKMLVMRYKGTYKNVPLEGVFVIRVGDGAALVCSFQAPTKQMGQLAPTMQYIMTSLRFGEPLQLQRYRESNEGAFTGSAPQGWSVRASMQRSPDSARQPLIHIFITDPTGTIRLELPPQYEQFTEQMNPAMMNPMMTLMGGGGPRSMPVQTAVQYIQRVLIPRIQQQHGGAQIEGIEPRRDLSEHETMEAAQTDHFGFGTVCDVASVTYTQMQNGVRYRTKDFVQITHLRAIGVWTAKVTGIMRAPAEQFEEQEAIFMGIVEAVQPDEQWQQREQARSDQYFMQSQQRLARVQQQQVAAIHNLHQTRLDIAQNMRADINRRNANFSALQQDMDRVIAGYQYVYDPIDQKVYDVPVGPGQLWGGDGYVYSSDSGLTPPKIGLHRLDPLG